MELVCYFLQDFVVKIQSKWSETMSIVTFLFVIGLFLCPECIFSFQILLNFQLALKEKVIFAKTKSSRTFTYLLSYGPKKAKIYDQNVFRYQDSFISPRNFRCFIILFFLSYASLREN